jgi:hypothetical protein
MQPTGQDPLATADWPVLFDAINNGDIVAVIDCLQDMRIDINSIRFTVKQHTKFCFFTPYI